MWEMKHSDRNEAEYYCWAMTQARGGGDHAAADLVAICYLDAFVRTYAVECTYIQFQPTQFDLSFGT